MREASCEREGVVTVSERKSPLEGEDTKGEVFGTVRVMVESVEAHVADRGVVGTEESGVSPLLATKEDAEEEDDMAEVLP